MATLGTEQDQQPHDTWVGPMDGARFAQVSRTKLHYALTAGEIPHATIGGRRLIRLADLAEWVAARGAQDGDPPKSITVGEQTEVAP
jgi:hypothetical protein